MDESGETIEFARTFYASHWNDLRAAELKKMFDLDPNQRVEKLSKGQGAKLSLLLAMSHDPAILILDEPTSGMDPLVRDEFIEGVLAVTSERKCVHHRIYLLFQTRGAIAD